MQRTNYTSPPPPGLNVGSLSREERQEAKRLAEEVNFKFTGFDAVAEVRRQLTQAEEVVPADVVRRERHVLTVQIDRLGAGHRACGSVRELCGGLAAVRRAGRHHDRVVQGVIVHVKLRGGAAKQRCEVTEHEVVRAVDVVGLDRHRRAVDRDLLRREDDLGGRRRRRIGDTNVMVKQL